MTDHDHDLCDLIAELDGIHQPWRPENEPQTICALRCTDENGAPALWPCDTAKIVDKYKRRAHRRRYIIHAAVDPAYPKDGPQLMKYAVAKKQPHQDKHTINYIAHFDTMPAAETWIEQQYEEK